MTNTITVTELGDAVRRFQGQNIYMTAYVQELCPDRNDCKYAVILGSKECSGQGHARPTPEMVVHVNFCELLSDQLVVHYSPIVEAEWNRHAPVKIHRHGRQRRLHIQMSSGIQMEIDSGRTWINLSSGRLRVIDLYRPNWW